MALGTVGTAIVGGLYLATREIVKSVVVTATDLKSLVSSKPKTKEQQGIHNVYVLTDKNNNQKVEYMGRTTDVELRKKQHKTGPKKDLEMVVILENASKELARGTEQGLIEYYETLNRGDSRNWNNKIRGVNPLNQNFEKYMNRHLII